MTDNTEYSRGGSRIIRHQQSDRGFDLAHGDAEAIPLIEAHIEKHVGDPSSVFHEILSDMVHIDVHVVQPTRERNYYTLVTSGMSDLPMHAPPGAEHLRFAEMVICLPPSWRLSDEDFRNEYWYWPVRWLKQLSRLPHEYQSWLAASHTVPNGDPAKPLAGNTALCCHLISLPTLFGPDFVQLKISEEKTIQFLSIVPIYKDEMNFKLRRGYDALLERFTKNGVSELLDITRPSVCKKRFGFF